MINNRVPHTIKIISYRSIYIYLLFAVIVLVYGIPFFSNPCNVPNRDSGVFLYMGQQILNGKIPYRDVWDHKGPVIYYINALGLLVSQGKQWGVIFIEILSLFSAVSLGYIVMSRAFGKLPAFFASISWLFGFFYVFGYENMTEEYGLPLSFAMLYLFIRFINSNMKLIYAFVIGIIFSTSLLLKPNNVGIQLSVILLVLLSYIFNRRYYSLIKLITVFVLGFIVITIPVLLYFQRNNALTELVDILFRYNSIYSKTSFSFQIESFHYGVQMLWPSGLLITASVAWILGVLNIERRHNLEDEQQALTCVALIGLPVEFILSSIPGRDYEHYYISWLPILAILTCLFAFGITKNSTSSKIKLYTHDVTTGHIWIFAFLFVISSHMMLSTYLNYRNYDNKKKQEAASIVQIIKKHLDGEKYLLMWGAETSYNFGTQMKSPTRYVYQFPLYTCGYTTKIMLDEFLNDISQNKPLIVDTAPNVNEKSIPPIDENKRMRWKYVPFAGYKFENRDCSLPPEMENVFKFINSHYKVVDVINQNGWTIYKYIGGL